MLIKIHPYVVKEKKKDGSRVRGHFAPPVFEMREMRARIGNQMIGWIMKKTQGRCPVKTRELERGENHQKAGVLISFFFFPLSSH